MFEISDHRAFWAECYYECAKHFPTASKVVIEQMLTRLEASFIEGPVRRMTESEMRQRCQQLIESLKGLENGKRK